MGRNELTGPKGMCEHYSLIDLRILLSVDKIFNKFIVI